MTKVIFYYRKCLKSNQFRLYSVCFHQLLIPSDEGKKKNTKKITCIQTNVQICQIHLMSHTRVCIYMNTSINIILNGENHSYIERERERYGKKKLLEKTKIILLSYFTYGKLKSKMTKKKGKKMGTKKTKTKRKRDKKLERLHAKKRK